MSKLEKIQLIISKIENNDSLLKFLRVFIIDNLTHISEEQINELLLKLEEL